MRNHPVRFTILLTVLLIPLAAAVSAGGCAPKKPCYSPPQVECFYTKLAPYILVFVAGGLGAGYRFRKYIRRLTPRHQAALLAGTIVIFYTSMTIFLHASIIQQCL